MQTVFNLSCLGVLSEFFSFAQCGDLEKWLGSITKAIVPECLNPAIK
jgi:hypothetical protein